uniref:Uncharacterized protein n=1 Tax=Schlesneria paludicola TaxID=360056 RepID=A0A7C4LNM1_9PLAN
MPQAAQPTGSLLQQTSLNAIPPTLTPQSPQRDGHQQPLPRGQRQRQQLPDGAQAQPLHPTDWQLQNPSGPLNQSPTEAAPRGYLAPNTYFGPAFREWQQMSGPITIQQQPFNQQPVPTVLEAAVPLAPNTYWGPSQAAWSNLHTPPVTRHAFGGWNTRP